MVFLAAFFDFLDGLSARGLKAYSAIGKSLDSLADLISFGLLPGLLILKLQLKLSGIGNNIVLASDYNFYFYIKILSPLLIPLFSAIRLAKFDNDPQQEYIFKGLPTPANALFIASLVISSSYDTNGMMISGNSNLVFLLSTLLSFLLISPIPFLSLKLKSFSIKENYLQYLLLIFALIFLLIWKIQGIMFTIGFYIILSLFFGKKTRKN